MYILSCVKDISTERCQNKNTHGYMRAICKVCGLTLLLFGALWRCSDGLFFKVTPFASDSLLTVLHPLLENMLQTIDHFEISCFGAPFSWLEKPRKHMGVRSGRYGRYSDGVPPIHFFRAKQRI
jgi:hypothetical protein